MIKHTALLTISLCALGMGARGQYLENLSDHNQKINYAFGQDIVSTFQQQGVPVDFDAFIAGLRDALAGNPRLTNDEKAAQLKEYALACMAQAKAKLKVIAAENSKVSQAFMDANAKKPGIQFMSAQGRDGSTTQLQYEVLATGTGASPKPGDTVEIHYTGSLPDGSIFDSSVRRGVPATYTVGGMLPGISAALQSMKVGDHWRLYLPPNLACGEYGAPGVGPNEVIIYDVRLLSFFTPKPHAAASPAPAIR